MENNYTKDNIGQEVDLWDILQRFGRWCAKTTSVFLIFLLRKSVRLVCFALVGVIVGAIWYIISTPFYSTYMLVRVNDRENHFFYANQINANFSTSENLAQKFAIPDSIAKQISSVRAYYAIDANKDQIPDFIDEKNIYMFSNDSVKADKVLHNLLYINAQVYSNKALPYIRQSIVDFINKNEYAQRYNMRRVMEINERVSYLQQQVRRLDSLQQYEYFQKASAKKAVGSGQLLVLNEQVQSLYHNELISLNSQITRYNTELQLYAEPITIVQDFAETYSRKNSLTFCVKNFIIFFLLVGLIFVLIQDHKKTLARLYRGKVVAG
ncbi:MAG: hypothetical protein LBO71_10510 [Prevotellaceae bacterium]|jgi:hypothetical protein|nr:hypothetical protein [Prevotellaceae bacterium]